ncbi:elongator complex protein 4 [Biomphalaria glabrata]|nr:elongator complex protein 4 [Biomphalaria glabrata]
MEKREVTSSFQKRAKVKIGQIPGTRPSLYNNQLLISTGIPSLDNVVGGGLAVGTVFLVDEDVYGSYARIMLKYFIAEGIMTKQSIFLSSAQEKTIKLVEELPAPLEDPTASVKTEESPSSAVSHNQNQDLKPSEDKTKKQEEENLKIAWRYRSKPKVKSSIVSNIKFGHYYDLTKTMSTENIAAADISHAPSPVDLCCTAESSIIPHMNVHYCRLLDDIRSRIEAGKFGTAQQTDTRNILRIGIHSIGSPLWGEMGGLKSDGTPDPSLSLFLIALRGVLRSAFAVAMLTLPGHLFHDDLMVNQLSKLCDTVIKLDSFAGSDKEKNPAFKEYHGLLHVKQLPRLNSFIPAQPETSDLAFKLRRKKFTVEKLHLPPELSDTPSRTQSAGDVFSLSQPTSGCGSTSSSKLSF